MPPKMPEVMQFRENRLETFENGAFQGKSKQKRYWTHDKPSPEVLADHGFYFTPTKLNVDQITCYNCKRKETNVGGVENIAAHHLEGNPNCSLSRIISQQIQHLTSDLSLEEFWDRSDFKDVNSKECVDMRKKTFGLSWKFDGQKGNKSTANSMALARAGFYYCPLRFGNDRVQCVYCNSSLDTWSTDDIPIEEHKANSPGCYFLQKYTLLEIAKPKKEKVKPKREQNAEGNKSGEPEEKVNKRTKEKNKPSSNISSEILIENIKVSKRRGAKSRILDRILDSEAEEEEDDEEKEDENANAKEKEKVEEKETTIVNEDEAEEEEKVREIDESEEEVDLIGENPNEVESTIKIDNEEKGEEEKEEEGGREGDNLSLSQDASEPSDSEMEDEFSYLEEDEPYEKDDDSEEDFREDESDEDKEVRITRSSRSSRRSSSRANQVSDSFWDTLPGEDKKVDKLSKKIVSDSSDQPVSKKRTTKAKSKTPMLHNNISFDDDRFQQILASPKKSKKIKINGDKDTPPPVAPSFHDLSNHNLGDYEEEDIEFLENNVKIQPTIKKTEGKSRPSSKEKKDKFLESLTTILKPTSLTRLPSPAPVSPVKKIPKKRDKRNIEPIGLFDTTSVFDEEDGAVEEEFANELIKSRNNNQDKKEKDIREPIRTRLRSRAKRVNEIDDEDSDIFVDANDGTEVNMLDQLDDSTKVELDENENSIKVKVEDEEVIKESTPEVEDKEAGENNGIEIEKEREEVEEVPEDNVVEEEEDEIIEEDESVEVGAEEDGKVVEEVEEKGEVEVEQEMIEEELEVEAVMEDEEVVQKVIEEKVLEEGVDEDAEVEAEENELEEKMEEGKQGKNNETGEVEDVIVEDQEGNTEKLVEEVIEASAIDSTMKNKEKNVSMVAEGKVEVKETAEKEKTDNGDLGKDDNLDEFVVAKPILTSEVDQNFDTQKVTPIQTVPIINTSSNSSNHFSSKNMETPSKRSIVNSTKHPEIEDSSKLATSPANFPETSPLAQNSTIIESPVESKARKHDFETSLGSIKRKKLSPQQAPIEAHDLIESSTPQKSSGGARDTTTRNNVSSYTSSGSIIASTLKLIWKKASFARLLDNLNNMETTSDYLHSLTTSEYDLNDDYDGELTSFISNMPEEEEEMTLQQWIRSNAANSRKLIEQVCTEMIETYRKECLRAMSVLENMQTTDDE